MVGLRLRRGAALIAATLALAVPRPARAESVCADERPGCVELRLTVRRAGDRVRLAQTRVTVAQVGDRPRWTETTQTDDDGELRLRVPGGPVRVVVLTAGYERFDTLVTATGSEEPVMIVLDPASSNPYRTVVRGQRDVQPGVSPRRLDREEIATLPGSQGDALRALQSMPGVARTPGGLGLLVLRGASPNQSVVFVGEHRVPRAFHALAIASVVPSDALDEVELVPGNFSSRYGNGTGGAVIMRPRAGRRDGFHGFAEVDLAATGAMLEGPLGKGSFLVAAQRSYVDAFLRVVEAVEPNELFVLPTAWDYQMFVDQPIAPGTTLTTRVLGSEDTILSRFFNGVDVVPGLELRAGFHRVDLELRSRRGPWSLLLSPSFRVEHQSLGDTRDAARRRDYITSLRAELSRRIGRRTTLTLGADSEIDRFEAEAPSFEAGLRQQVQAGGLQSSTGLYVTTEHRLGVLSLMPGVRLSAFTLDDNARLAVDPRLLARVRASDAWTWSAGVGLYSQPQVDADIRSGFSFVAQTLSFSQIGRWQFPNALEDLTPSIELSPEGSQIRIAQALQASTAVAYAPSSAWTLEAGAYIRARDESLSLAPDPSGQVRPEYPPSSRSHGVELLLRRHNVGRLYGWVSYTLSWAQRRYYDLPPDLRVLTDPFDQRHNLAIVGSYALPRHWRIGGRFRLVSGSPLTPYVAAIDTPTSSPFFGSPSVPVSGLPNSERFPLFHQLDLRVDKRWYAKRVIINTYLDVQNVYNRQNVEAYYYSADFRRRDSNIGLPIFPSIGVRVDY